MAERGLVFFEGEGGGLTAPFPLEFPSLPRPRAAYGEGLPVPGEGKGWGQIRWQSEAQIARSLDEENLLPPPRFP